MPAHPHTHTYTFIQHEITVLYSCFHTDVKQEFCSSSASSFPAWFSLLFIISWSSLSWRFTSDVSHFNLCCIQYVSGFLFSLHFLLISTWLCVASFFHYIILCKSFQIYLSCPVSLRLTLTPVFSLLCPSLLWCSHVSVQFRGHFPFICFHAGAHPLLGSGTP